MTEGEARSIKHESNRSHLTGGGGGGSFRSTRRRAQQKADSTVTCSHLDSLKAVKKSQNSCIKMGDHKSSKSRTPRLTNFETLVHTASLPSVYKTEEHWPIEFTASVTNVLRYSSRVTANNYITIRSTGLPEKLTGSHLLKKFPAFYGTQKFITALTRARHLSPSWARSIHPCPPSHFSKIHFNIILPSTPRFNGK
jgi:hypothetical protein